MYLYSPFGVKQASCARRQRQVPFSQILQRGGESLPCVITPQQPLFQHKHGRVHCGKSVHIPLWKKKPNSPISSADFNKANHYASIRQHLMVFSFILDMVGIDITHVS